MSNKTNAEKFAVESQNLRDDHSKMLSREMLEMHSFMAEYQARMSPPKAKPKLPLVENSINTPMAVRKL